MAVDAAVRQQTHQVEGFAVVLGVLHGFHQSGVLVHVTVLGGLGDAGQLLVDNAAGADVGCGPTSLLPIWPSGRPTSMPGSANLGVGVLCEDLSRLGLLAAAMALPSTGSNAEAVQDHQNERFFHSNDTSFPRLSRRKA